ncbi:MAG: hypothetical protein M3209_11945 [Acidobacteriota bacterium]|nr:hypothetical protein [Acidobacteriota bacterium]
MFGKILGIYIVPFLLFLFQEGSGGGTEGVRNTAAQNDPVGFNPIVFIIVGALALIVLAIVGLPFVMNYRRQIQQKGNGK